MCVSAVSLMNDELVFSLGFSVKGYTSPLRCALCGNSRNRANGEKERQMSFPLTGYPVLSRAAWPILTSSPLLTSDPTAVWAHISDVSLIAQISQCPFKLRFAPPRFNPFLTGVACSLLPLSCSSVRLQCFVT